MYQSDWNIFENWEQPFDPSFTVGTVVTDRRRPDTHRRCFVHWYGSQEKLMMYGGEPYLMVPGKDTMVPFAAAIRWMGDPTHANEAQRLASRNKAKMANGAYVTTMLLQELGQLMAANVPGMYMFPDTRETAPSAMRYCAYKMDGDRPVSLGVHPLEVPYKPGWVPQAIEPQAPAVRALGADMKMLEDLMSLVNSLQAKVNELESLREAQPVPLLPRHVMQPIPQKAASKSSPEEVAAKEAEEEVVGGAQKGKK